jgi:PAS domain S-box-containing protein
MAIRRATSLGGYVLASEPRSLDPAAETIALMISLFWLWGMFFAGPVVMTDKSALHQLAKGRQRLWEILNNTGVGYLRFNREGRLTEANDAFARLHDCQTAAELLGAHYRDLTDPEDAPKADEAFRRALGGEGVNGLEIRKRNSQGLMSHYRISAVVVKHNDQVLGAEGIALDVTRERQAMISLQRSEERFRGLYQQIPLGYQSLDEQGRILEVNLAWEEMTGASRTRVTGRPFADFLTSESGDLFLEAFEALRRGRRIRGLELQLQGTHGSCPVLIDAQASGSEEGQFEQAYCILTDVSELKATQAHLQKSLAEKDVLLREVHHRVKNNLQLISSLLSLQSQRVGDEGLSNLLASTQSRIYSIALLHEALLDTGQLARPDMPSYLSNLTEHVRNSLGIDPSRVQIKMKIQDISLSPDQAMRCGLIVNELVSNALEHAFVSDGSGEVGVEFFRTDQQWCLKVWDDGQGRFQHDKIRDQRGLGLELVDALCRQLEGEMEISQNGGTTVTIHFRSDVSGPRGQER